VVKRRGCHGRTVLILQLRLMFFFLSFSVEDVGGVRIFEGEGPKEEKWG
jgi:hypothetical protein